MSDRTSQPLSYREAGVDIDAGQELVERIGPAVAATRRPEVLGSLGGFGGLFAVPAGYRDPVLVAGTDGVGTKLRLALDRDRIDGLGTDLVAMCANDVAVTGAEPLFFLDYYATGRLDVARAARLIEDMARACRDAGIALIGGETAELPGLYQRDDFDLAGFCVGIAERERLLRPEWVEPGSVLLGIDSSGPHANGYSLIRRILADHGADPAQPEPALGGASLQDLLLKPTRVYVNTIRALLAAVPVQGLAHITGGGITDNLPRVLPDNTVAVVERDAWTWPPIFDWLAAAGPVTADEMLRTFNCGIGLIAVVAATDEQAALACLAQRGEGARRIGRIEPGSGQARVIYA